MITSDELRQRASQVRLLAFDVDGVLTDGSLHYGIEGETIKRFDVKDGHGIVLWRDLGFPSAIITARNSKIVAVRAGELGIPYVLQGEREKGRAFERLLAQAGLEPYQVAYIGDDINDIPVLSRAGLAAMPADGRLDVKKHVHYVCEAPGGRGAVREVCELLIKAKDRWNDVLAKYPPAESPR